MAAEGGATVTLPPTLTQSVSIVLLVIRVICLLDKRIQKMIQRKCGDVIGSTTGEFFLSLSIPHSPLWSMRFWRYFKGWLITLTFFVAETAVAETSHRRNVPSPKRPVAEPAVAERSRRRKVPSPNRRRRNGVAERASPKRPISPILLTKK